MSRHIFRLIIKFPVTGCPMVFPFSEKTVDILLKMSILGKQLIFPK